MTHFDLTARDLIGYLLHAGPWLAAGAAVGIFYFQALRWNVRMFAAGQSLLLPLGIQLVRFALTAAVLFAITRSFGAPALLATTAGIVIARTAIVRSRAQ